MAEGIWRGSNAKWFETCDNSEDVSATFTTFNFKDSVQKQIVYGTMFADSVSYCKDIPGKKFFDYVPWPWASMENPDEKTFSSFVLYLFSTKFG
jgi:hypothetical protein